MTVGAYAKPLEFIKSMPQAMIADDVEPFKTIYSPQPAMFAGITLLDDDATTPGTNIVVDFKAAFDLPTSIVASWTNMFDAEGKIINATEKIRLLS